MKATHLLILCTSLALLSCSKKQPTPEELKNKWVDAILVNKTGFDGCGWVLLLNDTHLEPTNLKDFDIELTDGKPVSVKYVAATDMMSICMIGMIVNIEKIKER